MQPRDKRCENCRFYADGRYQCRRHAPIVHLVEPLARRQLIAYQFGKPLHLDTNRGVTYTATRFERLPLPFAPLQEGKVWRPPAIWRSVARSCRSRITVAADAALRLVRRLRSENGEHS